MRPGLDAIRAVAASLGNPQDALRAIHIAGTNGKGAVAATLDACLRAAGFRVGRYTSPHLVRLNERFFVDGHPVSDGSLEASAEKVRAFAPDGLTFFEALTAVAFDVFAASSLDYAVLETGLGGRLDATNICRPSLTVLTRIGLDHCDWLGGSVSEIAAEKAGIIKPGVPVVVGENVDEARAVIERRSRELSAPCYYAPDLVAPGEIPVDYSLSGAFNRENAITAFAALKVLLALGEGLSPEDAGMSRVYSASLKGAGDIVWPGRFQRVGNFLVDGAHNPPAARALAAALECENVPAHSLTLIAGFCGDKDVDEVLRILSPYVSDALALAVGNARSLTAAEAAHRMINAGISAKAVDSLSEAIAQAGAAPTLICGSLFLAGEALVELGALPWGMSPRFDPSERLKI